MDSTEERIWVESKAIAAGFAWADRLWAKREASGLEPESEFPGTQAQARRWALRIYPREASFFADGCLARARSRWAERWRRRRSSATGT